MLGYLGRIGKPMLSNVLKAVRKLITADGSNFLTSDGNNFKVK